MTLTSRRKVRILGSHFSEVKQTQNVKFHILGSFFVRGGTKQLAIHYICYI